MSRRTSLLSRGALAGGLLPLLLAPGCSIEDRSIALQPNLPDAGPAPDGAGECVSGATSCVSSTQRRVCGGDGRWSAAESCANACVGDDCGGVCVPGAQRCASGSEVQRCSELGEWGAAEACGGGCSGDGCLGECSAGASECFSPSQLRQCNEQGQWQTPMTCPFACQGNACGGECTPGSLRCDAAPPAPGQRCDEQGVWRDAPRCVPGPDGCLASSVDACDGVCTSLSTDPQNCGVCGRDCLGGECVAGLCQPVQLGGGFTNPSAVVLSDTHVYFREGAQGAGRVVRIAKAGGALEVVAQGVSNLAAVALGGEQLYFASGNAAVLGQGQVLRSNLDGTSSLAFSPLRAPGIARVIVPGLNVWYTEQAALDTFVYRAPLLSQGEGGAGVEVAFETVPGRLTSMTVDSGCLFYVTTAAPQEILRNCTPGVSAEVHYAGTSGDIAFQPAASTDEGHLYFAQGNTLSRIALDPPAAPEGLISGRVQPPSVDEEALYYMTLTGGADGAGCSDAYALFRASKAPGAGAPTLLLAPPLSCPTAMASDETSLYWVSADGAALLKLAK